MSQVLRAAAAAAAVGGAAAAGCHSVPPPGGHGDTVRPPLDDRVNKYYDPCWPERYNYTARQEVLAPFAVQVGNAQVIEQMVYNHFFEPGSDVLTPAGLGKLDFVVRRRPAPDPQVYLQTARDLQYDPAKAADYVAARQELNAKRAAAVHKYLAAQTADRPVPFAVTVIDPADPSVRAEIIAGATRGLPQQYQSGITGVLGGSLQGLGGGQLVAAPVTPAAPAAPAGR